MASMRWIIYFTVTPLVMWAVLYGIWRNVSPEQKSWECRPYPGYCDIDTDWRR